jgi:hypothetical protein
MNPPPRLLWGCGVAATTMGGDVSEKAEDIGSAQATFESESTAIPMAIGLRIDTPVGFTQHHRVNGQTHTEW